MSITKNENLEYPEPEAKDVVADKVIDGVTNPLATLAHAFVNSLRGYSDFTDHHGFSLP